jgi:hypothetical protein
MDRRTFVKTLAGLAGAAAVPLRTAAAQIRAKTDSLSVGALQPAPTALQRPAPAPTSTATAASTSSTPAASTKAKTGYVSGSLSLMLDGAFASPLVSVEGGDATAAVVVEPKGSDGQLHKHIGMPRYTDFAVELAEAPSGETAKWIRSLLDGKSVRRRGAILSVDQSGGKAIQREFVDALLSSFSVPVLDAAQNGAVRLALTFSPESTRFAIGDASKAGQAGKASTKTMRSASFRLSIKGLESACAHVSKIDALTFTQKVSTDEIGEARDYQREPGKLEVSDLTITVAETAAQPFYDWLEDFVIKGNNGQGAEKTGTLELLDSTMKDALMTLSFQGLGIFEARPMKLSAGSDAVRRTKVSMYCERVSLK